MNDWLSFTAAIIDVLAQKIFKWENVPFRNMYVLLNINDSMKWAFYEMIKEMLRSSSNENNFSFCFERI